MMLASHELHRGFIYAALAFSASEFCVLVKFALASRPAVLARALSATLSAENRFSMHFADLSAITYLGVPYAGIAFSSDMLNHAMALAALERNVFRIVTFYARCPFEYGRAVYLAILRSYSFS